MVILMAHNGGDSGGPSQWEYTIQCHKVLHKVFHKVFPMLAAFPGGVLVAEEAAHGLSNPLF